MQCCGFSRHSASPPLHRLSFLSLCFSRAPQHSSLRISPWGAPGNISGEATLCQPSGFIVPWGGWWTCTAPSTRQCAAQGRIFCTTVRHWSRLVYIKRSSVEHGAFEVCPPHLGHPGDLAEGILWRPLWAFLPTDVPLLCMLVQSSGVTSASLLLTLWLVCRFGERVRFYYRSRAFALSVLPVCVCCLHFRTMLTACS